MADKYLNKYRTSSSRLEGWDYSWNGSYFITICTGKRKQYFGQISEDRMRLSDIGRIACQYWNDIPEHFPFVELGESIVMPNHIHGIIIINKELDESDIETQDFASLQKNEFGPHSGNLASIIRGYKSGVTKYATINSIDFEWQPRFYDHIIRDHSSYQNIVDYIQRNPSEWDEDRFNR